MGTKLEWDGGSKKSLKTNQDGCCAICLSTKNGGINDSVVINGSEFHFESSHITHSEDEKLDLESSLMFFQQASLP